MDNIVLYDWLSVTSKIHSPEQIISLLGLDNAPWEQIKGAHGYKDRLYWKNISIHYNGSDDMGVWLELSGQGCRAFETYGHADYDFLFSEVLSNPGQMKITRLDVAFDDHTGILDIDTLISDTLAGNYVAKAKSWEVVQSNKGSSVIIGSPQSPVLIRIYDKAAEQAYKEGRTRGETSPRANTSSRGPQSAKSFPAPAGANLQESTNPNTTNTTNPNTNTTNPNTNTGTDTEKNNHWIRIELQMRDERAMQFVIQQLNSSLVVGETFAGVLLNYLRYVIPDPADDNKWRWQLQKYWANVIGEACKIKIYVKPGENYNLLDCEAFVYEQAGNAINALLQIYDVDTFLHKLQERNSRPNPKYSRMVKNYKAGDILNENPEP